MKRCTFGFFVFMISGIWMALGVPVYSQTLQNQTGIYTLGEVVVTGERDGVESISTVREITVEDIRNKNARTLNEALELLPGLDIRTGTDGVPRVNLRGFRSRHVLLLIDGIPFNSTFDGQFDPSIIPVENIAKIKVSLATIPFYTAREALAASSISSPKRERRDFMAQFQAKLARKIIILPDSVFPVPGKTWTFLSAEAHLKKMDIPCRMILRPRRRKMVVCGKTEIKKVRTSSQT